MELFALQQSVVSTAIRSASAASTLRLLAAAALLVLHVLATPGAAPAGGRRPQIYIYSLPESMSSRCWPTADRQ
jgi:hypothetical protein